MSVTIEKITALCKRRGLVYPSAEIYGGLNGVYDFGHLGVAIKENIRAAWRSSLIASGKSVLFFEGSLLGPHALWEASGHVANFHDPMVDCMNCKKRFRADELDLNRPCPSCGIKQWTAMQQFNMMFQTQLGASSAHNTTAYLRPETAQSIYVNFKNIISTNRVKIPFGVAQIGKAFRNEITPKQFLFRMREFEQMELEWFCSAEEAPSFFEFWVSLRHDFYESIGIQPSKIRRHEHSKEELAHYSRRCIDIEYEFPFGFKELEGIAHRGAFDLTQHSQHSGKDLAVHDELTKTSYMPHIVETSVGTDRLFLTVLFDAYHEDIVDGEPRISLRLHPRIAPIKAALLPLTKELSEETKALHQKLSKELVLPLEFDESGSIGKRYRRQDEIGTPFCITYDFESKRDNAVTIRDRNTIAQERVAIDRLTSYIKERI